MKKLLVIIVICGLVVMIPVTAVAGYLIGATITRNQQPVLPTATPAPVFTLAPTSAPGLTATPMPTGVAADTWTIDKADLPVVHFTPGGLFTDTERADLTRKVAEPATLYMNETGLDLVVILISKRDGDILVDLIGLETLDSMLYYPGNLTPDGYWKPNCMDACPFSAAFTARYPNIVSDSP